MRAQAEAYLAVVAELAPLYEAHWRELALHQDTCPLAPRWDLYEAMAAKGILHAVTLREDGGRLVGYWLGFVDRHLHYAGNVVASTDIFRILPEARGRHGGVRLFRAVERHVRALGADRLMVASKLHADSGRLFTAMGFKPVETVYSLQLGQA